MSLKTVLKDFQVHTVEWMKFHEEKYDGGLLLNQAGTGKSLCLLSTIISKPFKTLIICPAGIIDNWMNEIHKHTTLSNVQIVKYYGKNRHNIQLHENNIIYITSYSIISREFNGSQFNNTSLFRNINFERIILDEAHYIRNVYSSVSKSVMSLSGHKKWIVTATPIFNDPNDAFAYFKFLGYEGIDTKRDWTNIISKSVNGLHILNQWIQKYGLSLKKSEVLKELKDKNEIKVELNFSNLEQEFYDALKEYSQTRMKILVHRINKLNRQVFNDISGSMRKILHSNVMVYILRLKQACNSPLLILQCMERLKNTRDMKDAIERLKFFNQSNNIDEECPICYDKIADYIAEPCGHKCCESCWKKMIHVGIVTCPKCRVYVDEIHPVNKDDSLKTTTNEISYTHIKEFKHSTKIQKLLDITHNIIQKKEKIVIVTQWVSMLKIIKHVFENDVVLSNIKTVTLQGNVPLKNRTEAIKEFQNNNDIQICFVSLMSSAEGINLIASNHMVLMDAWWNDAKMTQVMDRIHRIGQTKDVIIYHLQIKNSIEEQIEQLIYKKHKMANLVINKWNIRDIKNYDDSWIKNIIKLIEKPKEIEN